MTKGNLLMDTHLNLAKTISHVFIENNIKTTSFDAPFKVSPDTKISFEKDKDRSRQIAFYIEEDEDNEFSCALNPTNLRHSKWFNIEISLPIEELKGIDVVIPTIISRSTHTLGILSVLRIFLKKDKFIDLSAYKIETSKEKKRYAFPITLDETTKNILDTAKKAKLIYIIESRKIKFNIYEMQTVLLSSESYLSKVTKNYYEQVSRKISEYFGDENILYGIAAMRAYEIEQLGSRITLYTLDSNGKKKYLDGVVDSREITLAPNTEAPFWGTIWVPRRERHDLWSFSNQGKSNHFLAVDETNQLILARNDERTIWHVFSCGDHIFLGSLDKKFLGYSDGKLTLTNDFRQAVWYIDIFS